MFAKIGSATTMISIIVLRHEVHYNVCTNMMSNMLQLDERSVPVMLFTKATRRVYVL